MKRPKQSRVRRPPLTEAQLDGAVGRVLRLTDFKPRAVIYLSILAGARPSDVVALHLEDLDRTPGRERIRFRDRKSDGGDEWHPLSPVVADVVGLYLDQYDVPGGYLFPGRRGRMTVQAVSTIWARVVGVAADGMPSQARKWFADQLKRAGEDLDTIRVLLGHAQLTTTQIYLHTDEEDGRRGVVGLGDRIRAKELDQPVPGGTVIAS
jgi:integrase